MSARILIFNGRLLPNPAIDQLPLRERITVLLSEEVATIKVPDEIGEGDRFYRHNAHELGALEANVFLDQVNEGITLLVNPELGSSRIFIRIAKETIHIYRKDELLSVGTYAIMTLTSFMKAYGYQSGDLFIRRISEILRSEASNFLLPPTDMGISLAKEIMNWNGLDPKTVGGEK